MSFQTSRNGRSRNKTPMPNINKTDIELQLGLFGPNINPFCNTTNQSYASTPKSSLRLPNKLKSD